MSQDLESPNPAKGFIKTELTPEGTKMAANRETLKNDGWPEDKIEEIVSEISRLDAALQKEFAESKVLSRRLEDFMRKAFLSNTGDGKTRDQNAWEKANSWDRELEEIIAADMSADTSGIIKLVKNAINSLATQKSALRNSGNKKMQNLDESLRT